MKCIHSSRWNRYREVAGTACDDSSICDGSHIVFLGGSFFSEERFLQSVIINTVPEVPVWIGDCHHTKALHPVHMLRHHDLKMCYGISVIPVCLCLSVLICIQHLVYRSIADRVCMYIISRIKSTFHRRICPLLAEHRLPLISRGIRVIISEKSCVSFHYSICKYL